METKSTHATRPKTGSAADWSDIAELQKRILEASDNIANMTEDAGKARHILEYDSDRRKRALANAMVGPLKLDESASAAEAYARASDGYKKEMTKLGNEHQAAEEVVCKWEAEKIKWETARSLLAMCRTQVGL